MATYNTDDPARARAAARSTSLPPDRLRLLARVARMYHEQGIRQPEIAQQLHISQSRVSRLLKQAVDAGVVRTVITLPGGVYPDVEERLQARFGLADAVVVDQQGDRDLVPSLGAATAEYLNETLMGGERIGISSWSSTLLAAVDAMQPKVTASAEVVTQLMGGLGDPSVQRQATRLVGRLADVTGANAMFLAAPGLVSTPSLQRAILKDAAAREVTSLWGDLSLILVGIGGVEPSPLLRSSGNAIADEEQEQLVALGAVGDVCLRYYDAKGRGLASAFDKRVVGIKGTELRQVPRRLGVAGGEEKYDAIRGAVLGGWINILVTDVDTARHLLEGDRATAGPA